MDSSYSEIIQAECPECHTLTTVITDKKYLEQFSSNVKGILYCPKCRLESMITFGEVIPFRKWEK